MTAEYPSAAAGIRPFFLEDEMVLFSERSRELFRLNTSGAFIWCCMQEGLSARAIADRLAETFGISPQSADRDVRRTVATLKKAKLLEGYETVTPQLPVACRAVQVPVPLRSPRSRHVRFYTLAGRTCRILFPDRQSEEAVHPMIAHLEGDGADGDCATQIEVTRTATGFSVSASGNIDFCGTLSEVAPLVHGRLLLWACETPGCLAVLHAAAIGDSRRCLLFPGDSGSGKSTFAAAMVASGFRFLSDEVALVTPSPCRVLPVPLSFSLKEGSWPALSPFFQGLGDLPVYLRPDGKRVRYLSPPDDSFAEAGVAGLPVAGIIFPRYRPETTTRLSPLSPAEALCRIAEGGYDLNPGYDNRSIGELVSWISGVPCFELSLSDLSQAVAIVGGLL